MQLNESTIEKGPPKIDNVGLIRGYYMRFKKPKNLCLSQNFLKLLGSKFTINPLSEVFAQKSEKNEQRAESGWGLKTGFLVQRHSNRASSQLCFSVLDDCRQVVMLRLEFITWVWGFRGWGKYWNMKFPYCSK